METQEITPLTLQECGDKIWNHFFVENQPFGFDTQTARCVYRGPKGEKCAVGCLIPDSLYDPKIEGKSSLTLLDCPNLSILFKEASVQAFIRFVQSAHDNVARSRGSKEEFHDRFLNGCSQFGINTDKYV